METKLNLLLMAYWTVSKHGIRGDFYDWAKYNDDYCRAAMEDYNPNDYMCYRVIGSDRVS